MPASTLEDAFNALDPHLALTLEEIPALFVARNNRDTKDMQTQLQISRKPVKFLFVGNRGAGKSTELNYLSTQLRDRFVCLPVPLHGIFKSPNVTHAEVIFGINLRLLKFGVDEEMLPKGAIPQIRQAIDRPLRWFKETLFGVKPNLPDGKTDSESN